MPTIGVAEVLIRPSFKDFQREVGKETDKLPTGPAEKAGGRIGGALKAGAAVGIAGIGAGLAAALTKGFGRLKAIEDARAKLTGLGHDIETVETIMQNANESVKGTSFGLGEAATAAAGAVASGVKPGQELERTLTLIGDSATIAGIGFDEMGAIFNKISAQGKIQGEELAQLGERGIPILQLLGEELGASAEEVRELASRGEIDFATFQNAMEGGMGGAAQKSGETMTGAFKNTMAALGRVGANLMSDVYPLVRDFFSKAIEWLGPLEEKAKVVGEAVGSFLRDTLIPALKSAFDWFQQNKEAVQLVASVVAGLVVGLIAMKIITTVTGWIHAARAAMLLFNAAVAANPIGLIITVIGALVGALVWLYNNNETARNIMNAAWEAIQNAVKFAWESIIKPTFDALVGFVNNVLAPAFQWLWENVLRPVWIAISGAIQIAWGIISTIFHTIKWVIQNVVAPIFTWLWKNIIKPVWDGISSTIKDVWENHIQPVFTALGGFIEDKVKPAFERGVEGIKEIWNTIRNIAAAPINFVIGTVYNDGLRKALNKVRSIVGGDPLPELATIPKFAKGGLHKGGWALVGEEGPELVDFGRPGRVYTATQTEAMLAGKQQMPKDALAGGMQSHAGVGGFWSDFTGGVSKAFSSAVSWIRGGLAKAAGLILNPLKDGLAAMLPDSGIGDLAKRATSGAIEKALDWIRGKDEQADGGPMTYDGPLGSFARPAGGVITSGFGASRGRYPHAGIDFAVPVGTMVRAMLNGVVRKIGWNAVAGRTGMGMVLD
ncbi:tape measure protein, partial [Zhihengliuella flava]